MIQKKTIAQAYAVALYNVAEAENSLERVESELYDLKCLLKSDPKLKSFLADKMVKEEGKKSVLDEIFGKKVSSVLLNHLKLIVAQSRVRELPEIIDEFLNLSSSASGLLKAEVVTAVELTDKIRTQILAKLKEIAGTDVSINSVIDESIVGGMVIKLGDKIIDSSIRKKLDELKKHIASSY